RAVSPSVAKDYICQFIMLTFRFRVLGKKKSPLFRAGLKPMGAKLYQGFLAGGTTRNAELLTKIKRQNAKNMQASALQLLNKSGCSLVSGIIWTGLHDFLQIVT